MKMPTAVLQNNLVVGNFSSPHSFIFDDGTILNKCSPERSKLGELDTVENVVTMYTDHFDIDLTFYLNENVIVALDEAKSQCDILIVPLPVMEAMKAYKYPIDNCRVIRVVDRINKIVSSKKFCI